MKHLIPILFLSVFTNLFGQIAVTENEPSALIEGVVNAITGDFYALEDDIIIQGTEPLRLKRSYISATGNGKWHFFENLHATLYPLLGILTVNEPNGTALTYRYELEKAKHKKKHKKNPSYFHPLNLTRDAQGLTNTARGKISAHTNLKNQCINMAPDGESFIVLCPNGTKRTYQAIPDQKPETLRTPGSKVKVYHFYHYRLLSEDLPNGNKILYSWHKSQLKKIHTTDPSSTKTYAYAAFHYHGKIKEKSDKSYVTNVDFDVHTSDSRTLQYRYFCDGKPHKGTWYLHQVSSADSPLETIHYHSTDGHRKPIISSIALPHSRNLQINYYGNHKNSNYGRVQNLSSPVGIDSTSLGTHHFHYDLAQRMTTVTDIKGIPTNYYWDDNLRLTRIDRFLSGEMLYCSTLFIWGANHTPDAANLICKVFCDEQRKPMHATAYVYDPRGNVLTEKFYGNLSGQGAPLILGHNQLPLENGVEVYTKKFEYSQDGRNLLLRKEEDNGLVVTYDYLPGTDLLVEENFLSQNQIKKRKSYEYDENRILIREITEGNNVHLIQHIHPKPEEPFLGMPQVIEEKCSDGNTEKLLKKTVLHYTTGGRIAQKDIYGADNKFSYSLIYVYDGKGNLHQETNAIGQTATSHHDDLGNKIWFQDFSGRCHIEMDYDYSNRLTSSKETGDDGCVRLIQHKYDQKHNKILTIDPHGYETHYVYDSLSQLKEIHLPPIAETTPIIHFTYDAAGREITRTDAKGYTTSTSYNAYGKPTSILYPDGTQERFTYYLDGSLCTHSDQNGTETTYLYDMFKRILSITKSFQKDLLSQETFLYDTFNLIQHTDAEGNITSYEYDNSGRKIAEESNQERIEYTYDNLGRLHTTKQNELYTIYEHDLLDRITEERKEDSNGNLLFKISYSFDNAGNKTTIIQYINNQEAIESLEYDSFKRLIAKRDPLGHRTTTTYDDQLHTETITDPLGLQTITHFNSHFLASTIEKRSSTNELLLSENNHYDLNDNLISKKTILLQRTVTTLWDYDSLDRLLSLTEAANTLEQKITSYTYTSTGKLFQTIKPSGITITNLYTPLDNLASQISSDGTIHYTYAYNRLGHLLESKNELDQTILQRSYDLKGRLLTEKLANNLVLHNSYDTQGRRTCLKLFDQSSIIYDYNPLYLRKVIRYSSSGDHAYTHAFTSYDLAGNLIAEELIENLGSQIHTYDLVNRPTSLSSSFFSHEILQYDPVGNIREARFPNETLNYTYDDLYQITSENNHTYLYDALHNRLQKDSTTYTINALNQIPSELHYNSDGNPDIIGNAQLTYDALDRLICIQNDLNKWQFTYDSYHRRLSKTLYTLEEDLWKCNTTVFFIYDGQNEIGSTDAYGNLQELRILGSASKAEIGAAIAFELRGKLYVPIHDLYGNVAMVISPSDQMNESYRYTAFGEELNIHTALSPWRFSSKRVDEETGLVYFGRRYYSPTYGRWLTPDPLGLDAGANLYAYVFNAPLTHLDLYGLEGLSFEDLKQTSIGSVHGVGLFVLNTLSFASTAGWGLSSPLRTANWATGRSSLSQDWNSFQRSNTAFQATGEQWMQRILPGDMQHRGYQSARNIASGSLELITMVYGGVKGAYSLIKKGFTTAKGMNGAMQKIARPPAQPLRPQSSHLLQTPNNQGIKAKQIWTATKKRTSVQNAFSHWKNHGHEFPELLNSKQYVEQTHNLFTGPRDRLLTKIRSNGEVLFYDAQSNTFSAFTSNGVPKTMFKPTDGIKYWETRN